MKSVDIKTGFDCNNNCLFCVQANNKYAGNRSLDEIKRDLLDCKPRCDKVVLTGGEVTIRNDIIDIIKFAKNLNYKIIQLQSNGRMFSSLEFCQKALAAGTNQFAPALHGYCAEQHDSLTRAKGSFMQTVRGIKNLRSLGVFVSTNSVAVEQNYTTLPRLAKLLVKLDVNQFQMAFVHAMGNAWKNFDTVVPSISKAAPFIHQALQIGIDAGKIVMAEAMPYCHMKGYEDYVAENFIPDCEVRGKEDQRTNDHNSLRKNYGKTKFPQCKECKYNSVCEGPWKDYVEKRGDKEFVPVK